MVHLTLILNHSMLFPKSLARGLVSVFLLAWVLTACRTAPATGMPRRNATRAPTSTATATGTPSATLTATPTTTPTATLTPSPSPTPTPRPAALLEQAQTVSRNGDFATAIALLQTLLAENPPATLQDSIHWELGKTLWRNGQTEAAREEFAALTKKASFVQTHPQVYYWLGQAYAGLGLPEEAASAWRIYAERQPLLGSLAYEKAGDVYLAYGQPEQALSHYKLALSADVELVAAVRLQEKLAEASLQLGNSEAAIAAYQTILRLARNPSYRAEIWYRLGQAQLVAEDTHAAMLSFHQATITAPQSHYAYLALIALVNAGEPVDDLLRARIDLAAGAYDPAFAVLGAYLESHEQHSGEVHALMAQGYEQQGLYAPAATAWQTLREKHPDDVRVDEAWLGQARSLWRLGDIEGARVVYEQAASAAFDHDTAATALWWASMLAERDEADLHAAAADYTQLWRNYPESSYAAHAAFRAGLAYFRLNEQERAQATWEEVSTAEAGIWSAAADFWLGKLRLQDDDEAAAIARWTETVQKWGVTNYYGARAAQWLERLGHAAPLPPLPEAVDLATWLAGWAKTPDPLDLSAPLPEFQRPTALHRLGEEGAAYAVFESYRQTWRNDPVASLRLALYTQQLGYYDISIRAAARVATLSGKPWKELPLALHRLIYPIYYRDLIANAAQTYKLDPAILLALIRQESHFGATATSGATARGLAQVIPSTGRAIAQQLGLSNYRDELLYRPYISVDFGAFYLAQGIQQADGSVMQALAGYNGGPGNAAYWREQAGPDDDLLLELITFSETQRYVRTVLWQAAVYRWLYPKEWE